jgi:DNA modification methylase
MPNERFLNFLSSAFQTADAVMRPGAVYYVWHAETTGNIFRQAAEKAGWVIRQCLIWNKNHFTLSRQDYQWKHEPCLYGWKEGAWHYFFDSRSEATVVEDKGIDLKKLKKDEMLKLLQDILADKTATTVMDYDKPAINPDHPTMKPVRLIGYLMRNSSKKGDSVLDLFGGSGTTLIAAEQLGRRCYMMELDPHYCDVIIARWEKLTGRKAEKLN